MICPSRRPWKSNIMELSQMCLVAFGLILVLGVQNGLGIKCLVCNSASFYEGKACADADRKYVKDCDSLHNTTSKAEGGNSTAPETKSPYKYCRKLSQDLNGDYRIIRSCAMDGRLDKCVDRTGTKLVKIKYCECAGDECNSAASNTINVFMVFSLIASVFMFMRS